MEFLVQWGYREVQVLQDLPDSKVLWVNRVTLVYKDLMV